MTREEYFGGWSRVIDFKELDVVLGKLGKMNPGTICPSVNNIFKAFELCRYDSLKAVFLGQDPYPQKGVATGVLFGNSSDTPEDRLSPSLQVIREAAVNYEVPHGVVTFDNTMESWARQGILMINSALTCDLNSPGSHTMLWRSFISKLLTGLSRNNTGIVYVLFGRQAQTFEPYIDGRFNEVMRIEHPAYFARRKEKMPYSLFTDINKLINGIYGTVIEWYRDSNINFNTYENGEENDCFYWPEPL